MRQRIQRNISRKFVGEVGSRLISFAFNLVLARGLGSGEYGRYSYAYAFAGLVALCGEFGLNTLMLREASRDREGAPAWLRLFAPLRLLSVLLVALATVPLAAGLASRDRLAEIAVMGAYMAANTLLDYHSAVFSAFERMGWDAALRVVTRVSVSLFGIAAVLAGFPLLSVLAAVAAGNWVVVAVGWAWRRRQGLTFGAAWDWAFTRRALVAVAPIAVATIAGVLYFYLDSLLLSALGFSNSDLGEYGAASKILEASHGLPLIVAGGIFPVAAELARTGGDPAVAPFHARVARFSLQWGLPAAGLCAVIAPAVARLLYGPSFLATGPALALLALGAPLYYSNLVSAYLLYAQGHYWSAALLRSGAAVVKVAVAVAASRWLGSIAPAFGFIVADAVLFLVLLWFRARRGLTERGEWVGLVRIVPGIVAAVAIYLALREQAMVVKAVSVPAAFLLATAGLGSLRSRPWAR